MYLHLYAPYLRGKKYARELALVEGRITDFGISGKISQLSQFLKFPAALREFGMKKIKTLVLVGNDALLEEAVNAFALTPVTLGFVPVGESQYAKALAIPQGASAVDVLAARRIVKLDVGMMSARYFLGSISGEGQGIEVHTPQFSIFPKGRARVEVVNLGTIAEATDGLLTIEVTPLSGSLFKTRYGVPSRFYVSSCRLKSARSLKVNAGAIGTLRTPLQVDSIVGAIRMVVGRGVVRRT